jgi:hypothetical protein
MEDVLIIIGVFALGYVLTMGLLFALLKLFFPLVPEKADADSPITIVKISRNNGNRATRLRRVRLANG